MFFIDESGSIPKFRDTRAKNKYFVIAFVHTNDPRKVKNVYKRSMQRLRAKYSDFFASLNDPNECKGSEMLPFMKLYLLEKLFKSTDIKIGHMIVDNPEIDQKFREIPGRSFNYLIKIVIENFNLTTKDINMLELKVDNRNTALQDLNQLEGYLFNTLVLEKGIIRGVKVEYLESSHNPLIQVADIIANIVYQRFRYNGFSFPLYNELNKDANLRHPYTYEYLYNFMRPRIVVPYVYPVDSAFIRRVSASFVL